MSVRPDLPLAGAPRGRHRRRGRRLARALTGAGLCILLLAGGACGGSDEATTTCGDDVLEPLDPQSVVHVLPGAPEADGPALPTSGIHVMNPSVDPVPGEPLPTAIALGVLERSGVVIEHVPDLPPDQVADLEALATEDEGTVVVAPAPDLPAPVVARAWQHRLDCESADVDRLEDFIDDHLGTGSAMSTDTTAG